MKGKTLPPFPPAFHFGVATADHQCEAYVAGQDDVRDVWESVRGETGRGTATDFWNRYPDDVRLAAEMGCTVFRISLAWARLERSPGQWDAAAFEHYAALLQHIRQRGMKTIVTLLHNTWPLHVQAAGNGLGLLDPQFPDLFAKYARAVAERLGSNIDYYISINEPNQLVYGFIKPWWMRGYAIPPGLDRDAGPAQQLQAVEALIPNLFLAHSRARSAIRAERPNAMVGANPFLLGLPRWLQKALDRNAVRLKKPRQLHRQGRRLTKRMLPHSGKADLAIAQLTFDTQRSDRVLFSEPYLIVQPALLYAAAGNDPDPATIGVVKSTIWERRAAAVLPRARSSTYATLALAMDALARGDVDAILDDDVVLAEFTSTARSLRRLDGFPQPYCVAVAPGNHALLDAVDAAIQAFKSRDAALESGWVQSLQRWMPHAKASPPSVLSRTTLANIGRGPGSHDTATAAPEIRAIDRSLERIRKRGVLRVGVSAGTLALCAEDSVSGFVGFEVDLARDIAKAIFGDEAGRVRFVALDVDDRMTATRSRLGLVDAFLRAVSAFSTILTTNWWDLGMAGQLADFLCPKECVGALDFVGLDYYWGINALAFNRLNHLVAAAEARYANAPVWPSVFYDILAARHALFPKLPLFVIENGCVSAADGILREQYLRQHLHEVQRAIWKGIPVAAYVCWSITSNREWGLPFDDGSDFGLYRIDLDTDPTLTRRPTDASKAYQEIIARRSAQEVPRPNRRAVVPHVTGKRRSHMDPLASGPRVLLAGSERAPLPDAPAVELDRNERIEVTIVLRPHASSARAAQSIALAPAAQRDYVRRADFAKRYGARPADIEAVSAFARAAGLDVTGSDAARRSVFVAGPLAAFEAAFGANVGCYERDGGRFRERVGALSVPAELAGVIVGVFGIDNRPQARAQFRRTALPGVAGSVSYTPLQVAQAYDFPANADGTGQTVALIELGGGYVQTDLDTYFNGLGVKPPKVTSVAVDGASNAPAGNPNSADGEVMLDIEIVGAIAPGANIVVYFAPNTDQGFLDAITTAIHDGTHAPSIVSISWGGPESSWTQQALQSFDAAFADAVTLGVSVFAAAGDNGSSDGVAGGAAHVDFPASSPHLTACGGTRLTRTGASRSESVWNGGTSGGATGGGISDVFALPAYQVKAGVPPSANPGARVGRGVPDVAGDADPQTGYQTRVDGTDGVVGGTSAVAPLWAALTALGNQQFGKPLGFLNPGLYASPAAFHDITSGSNGAYAATPGWDACTGLGTPDGAKVIAALTAPEKP